ncbi:hypothetical protein [Kribbella sp. HUAS MG21]|uniref:Uncharacterized protein n=1 Tax=Kribbella sp. HUAS MG21 TaxID=3160966 RepID=A0AAU7TNJ9_9ACTN
MPNWGKKGREARADAVQNGGTLSGRQAKKAAKEAGAGRLGEDGKVRDTHNRVIGDFSGRTRRQGNEHGV